MVRFSQTAKKGRQRNRRRRWMCGSVEQKGRKRRKGKGRKGIFPSFSQTTEIYRERGRTQTEMY
jgi:hypothetical protein